MRKFQGRLDATQPTLANYIKLQEFARIVVDRPWLIASQSDCLMIVLAELMRAKVKNGVVPREHLDFLIGAGRGALAIQQLRDLGFRIPSDYEHTPHGGVANDEDPKFDGCYMLSTDSDVDYASEALSFGRHDA